MIQALFLAAWFGLLGFVTSSPSNQEWAQKSVYQIMTDRFARTDGSTDAACDVYKYCGGSWAGIINKLDYIQNLGFGAIQISPVMENIPNDTTYGEAYHGYWPRNLYALNDNFGSSTDLKNLVDAVHKRGMYIMVDVVINNMAQAIDGTMADTPPPTIYWSELIPFNDQKYYHPYCNITDWNDPTNYQKCWFGVEVVALPDLDTESPVVTDMIDDWIKSLLSNYSFDALRIDAAKHVNDAYLANFTQSSGVFSVGEVYDGDPGLVCRYQDAGLVPSLLNYPIYYPILQAFTAGAMPALATMVDTVHSSCKDFTLLVTFLENQDLPRFASLVDDIALAKNAMAFNILSDGIPMIWEGQEQHLSGNYSPYNREAIWRTGYATDGPLYNLTATVNKIRNHAISVDDRYVTNHSERLYLDGSTYATRKGPEGVQIVSIFSNQGSKGGSYELQLGGGFAPGTEVMELLTCTRLTASSAGNITVQMGAGEPKVLFPIANLDNSGLCGFSQLTTSAASNSTNSTSSHKSPAQQQFTPPISTLFLCSMLAGLIWLL